MSSYHLNLISVFFFFDTYIKRLKPLKRQEKSASENVICFCHLLNILANFSNLFLHTGKQCGPRSDCLGVV